MSGVPLFRRTSGGVELTSAGRALDGAARAALEEIAQLERAIRRLAGGRIGVAIAVSPTLVDSFLIPALWKFDHRPENGEGKVAIGMTMANSDDVRDDVTHRRVDFGIAASEPNPRRGFGSPPLQDRFLLSDEIVVAVGKGHELERRQARGERIFIEEIARTKMASRDAASNVRQMFDLALEERGLELIEPVAEVGAARIVIDEALEKGCPALLSRIALKGNEEMVTIDLYEETPGGVSLVQVKRDFKIVFLEWDALSKQAQILIEFLCATAALLYGPATVSTP
jgi:DNA-binding transcriptional LysR family regulator